MVDLFQQAVNLHKVGRVDEAGALYRQVIAGPDANAHVFYLLGNILLDRNEVYEARRCLIGAVKRDSANPHYHTALALAFERLGDMEMAESSLRMAMSLNTFYAEARLQLARIVCKRGDADTSIALYGSVLTFEPANIRAILAIVEILKHKGRPLDALPLVETAIEAGLPQTVGLRARCSIYDCAGDHRHALEVASEWLEIDPTGVEPQFAAGVALIGLNRLEDGLKYLLRVNDIEPGHVEAIVNIGHTLQKMERYTEAIRYYAIGLQREPSRTPALHGLTFSLYKTGGKKRPDNLRIARRTAMELVERDPGRAAVQAGLGSIYLGQLMVREGIQRFRKAVKLDGNSTATFSSLLFHGNYSDELTRQEHFDLHCEWSRLLREEMGPEWTEFPCDRDPERRLRVGFVTADLTYHPVAYFLLPLVTALAEHHDVYLYSSRYAQQEDDFTARFKEVAHTFRNIREMGDPEAAALARADKVDMLFDLSGHTTGHRLGLFSLRGAPVQVSWLGYPNTTGLDTMDYRISDAIVEPEGDADAYSTESIVRLPSGFHTYRPFYHFPDVAPLPALRRGYITLGCFNNLKKVSPFVMALWARVMKLLPTARLLLKDRSLDYPENKERIRSLFASHGVDSSRVMLSGLIDSNVGHLALYAQVDIALDSFPYNGTTTTCEALFMGCPVVTLIGDRHAARVSASLLTHAGHTEWIAKDEDEYVRLVGRLASDPAALAAIRARLRQDMLASPLCDAARFTQDFSRAIRYMWREWCAGHSGNRATAGAAQCAHTP